MAATQEKGVANPRTEALQEIEESRITQIKQEITDGGGNPDEMDETPIPVEEVVEEPEVVAEEPVVEPVVEPKKYTLKVDGEEIEVDEAAVIEAGRKTLQKESAADKRLEEASRIKKSVEDEAARIQQMIKDQQQPPAPSSDAQGDDLYGQVAQAIQYGSESEAKEALKNLVQQAATKGQPQELTLAQVQDFIEFRDATAWLNDEYKDVVADPILKGAFEKQEREMRTAGDARPYREIYAEIGENLRGWLKEKIPPQPPVAETKLERKAKVVTIPSASARQVAPDQEPEPTPSQLVEGMRKARKQS